MESYPFSISPDHFFFLFFQNFVFLIVLRFCFSFKLTWNHLGEKLQMTSLTVHSRFCQKSMHASRQGLYQSCIKICKISNFWCLPFWDHMGEKNFKHLVWKYTSGLIPKLYPYPWEWSLRKLYKELWNFKFLICWQFFGIIFGRLTWESMENYKMCDILDIVGRRAKRTKVWTSGVSI